MSRIPIKIADSCTFADYFKLTYDTEDVLAYFGYSYQATPLELPRHHDGLDRLTDLKTRITETLPHISLSNETTRREMLIAPVLMDLIHYTQAKLRIGYVLKATEQLKGELDYYLEARNNLLVIEAKQADLQKGFTQLAAELMALEQLTEDPNILYGVVSTGNIWQFGRLDRSRKHITQDLNLYRVPTDLEDIVRILVALL